jgi:hypothetical protein
VEVVNAGCAVLRWLFNSRFSFDSKSEVRRT